ncbi:restriction endonuclease subunit S [Pseudoxanthomonas sp. J31]|nr:restriction endonuclease subunit S [Pseudoxanthomonas sp. J31]
MKWPQGWREVSILDVCQLNPSLTRNEWPSDDALVSFVPMSAVDENRGVIAYPEERPFSEVKKGYTPFRTGDVLFAKVTPCMENGKVAIAEGLRSGIGFGSTEFHVLRPNPELLTPEYVFYFVRQPWFRLQAASAFVGTGGLQRVPPGFFKRVRLPLPPLPEQQRIVEVLHAAAALRQAKQRVLQGFDEVIQAQYRAQFGRYFTRQGLLNATRIGEHVESTQYGVSEAMAEAGSHAVLRMNSITSSGWLDLSDLKYADLSSQDAAATTLQDGDLLFNRTNSRELVGKCAIWRGEPGRYSFASYLVRLRLKPTLLPEYLWATLNSPYGKYRLFNAAKQAVSMANVSPTDLARISIPLPPVEEQSLFAAFVREVERQRGQISVSGARMQTLQPALITEALSGRLTAAWREQHAQALAEAARERDARLGAPTPQVMVRITEHAPAERRTDLARPRRQALIEQLSSFQHAVWNTLRVEWRGAVLTDDPAAFEEFCTSPQTAWRQEGFAAGREQVRRALEQLAAMGLIRKMSLPRPDPNTGRTEYLTAFRPLREAEDGSRPEEDTALADAERLGRELERRRAPEAR